MNSKGLSFKGLLNLTKYNIIHYTKYTENSGTLSFAQNKNVIMIQTRLRLLYRHLFFTLI